VRKRTEEGRVGVFSHDRLALSPAQIERLNNLAPASGERRDAGNMAVIDR